MKAKTKSKKHQDARPSWDEYFLGIAQLVSRRSTCLRRKVGAVVVKERRILATGYNGTPSGIKHCAQTKCLRAKMNIPSGQRHELCRGLHAEQNALLQAALYGIGLRESALYITNLPCIICAKMIINAGIKEVVIAGSYPDKMARQFLEEASIKVRKV
ncbi:cytidine/deoxycytidylate deaminase family protein [Candidatus Omnitrophota bacterium]